MTEWLVIRTLSYPLCIMCMPFEFFKGKLFENGKWYAKSDNTIQKGFKERIPNDILHVQFERKNIAVCKTLMPPFPNI